jgi:hypothetical protein
MLKLNKNQKRQPIGGHQFTQNGVTFQGETYAEVLDKVKRFRVVNCMPIGQPDQEILAHYAKHWPFMVQEDREYVEIPKDEDYTLWRKWIVEAWRNPPAKMLSLKEQSDRALICEKCQFNKKMDWIETNESAELSRRAFILRRGVSVASFLGFCSLHKADLSVFTFIDNHANQSETTKDAGKQVGCWLK